MASNATITVLIGDDAKAWAADEKNRAAWRALYATCDWGTTFQSVDFFDVWFRHYGAQWRPVLVLDRGLTALMPLAVANGVVTGVGAHQAEYHGWLGTPQSDGAFLKDAVSQILAALPGHEIRLRYLPPGTPGAALKALLDGDGRAYAQTHTRPLLVLDEAQINEVLRKKGNRSKFNRLKRLGDFAIRTMGADEFAERLDEIAALCDFRQGAVNDTCPFTDDARKGPFHLDWVRDMAREVHVSGMFVAGKLASILIFALSKREAHVAITAHAPQHAANSPGKIHIYEAALQLAREGFTAVDMTPGDDEWKLRFASKTDDAVDLTVFANLRQAIIARTRRAMRSAARSAAERVGLLGARQSEAKAPAGVAEAPLTETFVVGKPVARDQADDIRVNALGDLLRHGPGLMGLSRQTFLSQALARMEAGERCHSLHDATGMPALGWSKAEADTIALSGFVARGDVRNVRTQIVRRMLADMTDAEKRVAIPAGDADLRAVLEALGLQPDAPAMASR